MEGPIYVDEASLRLIPSITTSSEIRVVYNFTRSSVSSYKDYYVEIYKQGCEESTTYHLVYGPGEDRLTLDTPLPTTYAATFTGIYAKEMGDTITARLYAVDNDGVIHRGPEYSTSIKDKILSTMNSKPEFYDFGIAMLNYGAAAQAYFHYDEENLVNESLTDEQKIVGTPEATAVYSTTSNFSGRVIPSVQLLSKVTLALNFTGIDSAYADVDLNDLKLVVCNAESGEEITRVSVKRLPMGSSFYIQASYDNVGARYMRDMMTFTLYDGETPISNTLSWSVECYVTSCRGTAKEAITNAMLVYGDAAAAYFG